MLNFLFQKKNYCKIEQKINICIYVFSSENELTYPVCVSNEKFKMCINLLLRTDKNKSHYVHIKDFNRFMCNKTKNKNKKTFADVVYNVLVVKKF